MQLDKERESISFMSMSEKYEYLTKHLKTIRNGFLEVANDDDFKALLNSEIEKRFDGDDNVLLKVLEERSPVIFKRIASSGFIQNSSFQVSQMAFAGIVDTSEVETINLYPQIYIPNYLNLKQQGLEMGNPTIVSFNGDEIETHWEGVKLNSEGKVETVFVDENYVLNNLIWVISLNEGYYGGDIVYRLSNQQREKENMNARSFCMNSGSNCNTLDNTWNHGIVYQYTLKCDMDNLLSGLNDFSNLSVSTFTEKRNPYDNSYHSPQWIGNSNQRLIKKISKGGCIEDDFVLFKDWRIASESPPNNELMKGNLCFSVFYEHDNWPAPLRTTVVSISEVVTRPPTCSICAPSTALVTTSVNISFRSRQTFNLSNVMNWKPKDPCMVNDQSCRLLSHHPCETFLESSCMEINFKTAY